MEGNEKIQPHFGDGEFQQLAALLLPLYNSQASTCLACRSVHARHFPVLLCIEQLKLNYFYVPRAWPHPRPPPVPL